MKHKDLVVRLQRPIDSGWSWVVCLAAFVAQFLVVGTANSFGSFFVALLQEFQGGEGETAWIGSIAIGITFLNAPLATSLCDRWGCRAVMCLGSVIFMAGMLLSSLVPHLSLMYVTYGVFVGVGGSCGYFSSLYALTLHFNKHLALASGIAFAGAGAGTLSISLAVDRFNSLYGLRTTFQGMAGVSMLLFLAGLAFSPVNFEDEDQEILKQKEIVETKKQMKAHIRLFSGVRDALRPALVWKNKAFVVWTVTLSLTLIAYYIPYVYLVRLGEDVGVPTTDGALLVGYCAVSQILGKVFFGKLAESPRISRLTLVQIALLVMAVAACLCPLARSFTALLTFSVVSGFFDGCFVLMIGLVTQDIVGRQMMAKALGTMYGVVAIPMTIGPPIAGLLYDITGNYNLVFFLASGLVTIGVCLMFLIPSLLPPKRELRKVVDVNFSTDEELGCLHKNSKSDENLAKCEEINMYSSDQYFDISGEERNRMLTNNLSLGSRPNSFVLFSIVNAESYRDLSPSTERYPNSRATSRTSLTRLFEVKVDSRSNSCARLEPLEETDTALVCETYPAGVSASLDTLDVAVQSSEIIGAISLDGINEDKGNSKIPEIKTDFVDKDGVSIMISKSTESGFVSEESSNEHSEVEKFEPKTDEKRLSSYSWNSTGSDLSWKSQSDADTVDSGFAEVATPCSVEIDVSKGDVECHANAMQMQYATIEAGKASVDDCLEYQTSNVSQPTEICSSYGIDASEKEHSPDEDQLLLDPGLSDYYSQLLESQLEVLDGCACAANENRDEQRGVFEKSTFQKTVKAIEPFAVDLPYIPDIYSQLFEGILEEVNEYSENFPELKVQETSQKSCPTGTANDVIVTTRETEV